MRRTLGLNCAFQPIKTKYVNKTEEKLQWMYKGDKLEMEEYLLKRIDRHIEQDDKPSDDVAIFAERIQANIAMDMAAKAREDPLFAIRKKEEDVKRKLLDNPMKMKRLQKQKHKHKHSKDHDHYERKHRHNSDSEEHFDKRMKFKEENIKIQKVIKKTLEEWTKIENQKAGNIDMILYQMMTIIIKENTDMTLLMKKRRKTLFHGNKKIWTYNHEKRTKDNEISHRQKDNTDRHKREPDGLPVRKRHDSDSEEEKVVPVARKYGLIKLKPTPDDEGAKTKRSRSPRKHRSRSPVQKPKSTYNKADYKPRKLTEEEKKKKLEEMMDNAKWREDNRTMNVKRYTEEEKREKQERSKSHESGFLNSMMSSHAEQSSVEDRIKRNRYNLQRTKADLDKNFLKK
ncbi:unnamed protein product [Mytilus coruscus]|uniref:Uncharacterized protein n=1 Tax=Mytilus coruscus TaxID=42192 RepID=A0A6J8BWH9_MYTCO|nr:unnamed protein product [Mytilus coruscus]